MTTASNEGGLAPTRRGENGKMYEKAKWSQLKEMCPPHKVHEFDALKKKHNYDVEKITAEILSYWDAYDDRALEEDTWQDVSKRGPKRPTRPNFGSSTLRVDRVGGRGGAGRGGSRGGRGASARGAPADRRGDKAERAPNADIQERKLEPKDDTTAPVLPAMTQKTVPIASQSAWGQRSGNMTATIHSQDLEATAVAVTPQVHQVDTTPFSYDSTVSGLASKGQNVWATKGSAHLIEAEKVKPGPAPQKQQHRPRNSKSTNADVQQGEDKTVNFDKTMKEPLKLNSPLMTVSSTETEAMGNGLSASVNGANVNAAGWKPSTSVPPIDSAQSSIPIPPKRAIVDIPMRIEASVVTDRVPSASIKTLKPKTVLNMGHWETAAGEEAGDYSFGSFGADNDIANADDEKINAVVTASSHQTTSSTQVPESLPVSNTAGSIASARPPPGLAIPMPANVVHVHELENKLESASLASKKDESAEKGADSTIHEKKTVTSQLNVSHLSIPINQLPDGFNPAFPQGPMSQTFLGAYGMGGMGMYNYNPQNFMAVPQTAAAPVLSGGLVPPQPKQAGPAPQIMPNVPSVPQPSVSGYPQTSQSNPPTDSNRINETSPSAGVAIPPGMHGTMPYNPALYYTGQQPFQMGQPHGAGYGYGYGHVQGGFGYQHMMGQGAYGQHFDDQAQHVGSMNAHHSSNGHQANYNKNTGGYRGRNPHQYSQYQGQYGYGGQPYNIAYADHFNQLGGYGPGGMDPYMSNNGYPTGINSFSANQDDEHQSGSKTKAANRKFSSNPNMHQYQQGSTGFNDGSSASGPSSYQGGWNGSGL